MIHELTVSQDEEAREFHYIKKRNPAKTASEARSEQLRPLLQLKTTLPLHAESLRELAQNDRSAAISRYLVPINN